METDRSAQVRSMEERIVQCIREKRYDDAQVIGKDILPFLVNETLSVRLRIYNLLQRRCTGFHLSDVHQWHARAVAEDVMADTTRTSEERIRAHMLHCLLPVSPPGAPPDGSTVDPHRRWLPQELRELYAERATIELLGCGGGGNPALLRDAHIVRCHTCPDQQSVEAHLEALLEDGDEEAIVMGCGGPPVAFHKTTLCTFLDRALAVVKSQKAVAHLLVYKLATLLECYVDGPGEQTLESEERHRALYKDFIATMVRLELCSDALVDRAHGHLYCAALADWFGEKVLAEMHCDVAQALAEHLQDPVLQQAVQYCRRWMLAEEKGEGQGEDSAEEYAGTDADGEEEDDDDDDDDEVDFWKKT